MRITALVLIFIYIFAPFYIQAEDSTQIVSENESNPGSHIESNIPLYEQYEWSQNYLVNQPITNFLRWTPVCGLAGFAFGGIFDLIAISEGKHVFIPVSLVTSLVGLGSGVIIGTTAGFIRGSKYNSIRNSNSDFHTRRYTIGYMAYYEIAPVNTSNEKAYKGVDRYTDEIPKIFLIFRPLSNKRFLPDRFEAGWGRTFWGRTEHYEIPSTIRLYLQKVELSALYSLFSRKLFSLNSGLGVGYTWGEEMAHYEMPGAFDRHEIREVKSPFLKLIFGMELNLVDLMFTDISLQFEPVGIYQQIKDKDNFSYMQNLTVRFAAGSFIF